MYRKFKYNYKPNNLTDDFREFFANNSKPILIALISIFLIAGIYGINAAVGYFLQENVQLNNVNLPENENSCLSDLNNSETLSNELIEMERNDFDNLVRNSARPICCSSFDLVEGTVVKWNLVDEKFVCNEGSFFVNCSTGKTNY